MKRMPIQLDKPFPPMVDYNCIVTSGKRAVGKSHVTVDVMTQQKAKRVYNVVQELNFIREPQLALKKPAYGERKHGLI